MKNGYKKIVLAILTAVSVNGFGAESAMNFVIGSASKAGNPSATKVPNKVQNKDQSDAVKGLNVLASHNVHPVTSSSTTQQDSMSYGGSGSLTANINSETGELLISYPVGSVPGIGANPSLTLNYDNDSNQNIDGLGTGWSFNLTNYDISTHYLYVDGSGYYITEENGVMTFEGEHTSNNISFTASTGKADDGRAYQYVITTHAGTTEYLKTYTQGSNSVARVIESKDNMGNIVYYYYGDETDPSSTANGLLTAVKSNLGNEIKLDNEASTVTITLPAVFGNSTQRTITLTKGTNGVSKLAVSDGSDTTYNYGVSYRESAGQYFITQLSYPSGMYANIYNSTNDPNTNNYLNACSTYAACSSSNYVKMPVYEYVQYVDGTASGAHTLLNTTTDAQYGSNDHNFTGYPSVGLSSSEDMLLNSSNLNGYTYQTSQTTNNIKIVSTLNHEHLVTEQDSYDGSNLISKSLFTYVGETVGDENSPPPYADLSLDTYSDTSQSSITPYQFNTAGTTLTTTKQENEYGEVTESVAPDGSTTTTTYDDAHYGLPVSVVNMPATAYLKTSSSDDDSKVYPTYTQNTITQDSYGHWVISSSESGYQTTSDGGKTWTNVPVYHTDMTYDSHGRLLTKVLSYASSAPSEYVKGNIKTVETDYTYIDDATTSTNKALVCGLFSSGSCPTDVENNLADIQAVITTQTGTAYDGVNYGSISTAAISDKGTGLGLYALTDASSASNGIAQDFQHVSSTSYDAFGRTIESVDPLGEVTTMSYHVAPNDNYISTLDPAGNTLVSDFDNFGKIVKQTATDGTRTIVTGTKTYDYDESGNAGYGMLESSTDISGNIDTYFYDDSQQQMTDKATSYAQMDNGVGEDEQIFYHYTLNDRVHNRQISFSTYSCSEGQCIDSYSVKEVDPKTGELLHTYTLHADGSSLPDTYSAPTTLQTDFDDSTAAENIIDDVNTVIADGDWVSHTSMSYDGYHRLISGTKDVNSSGDTITVNKHYNDIGQLVSVDNNSASNDAISKLSSGDDDIQQRSFEYNLIGKEIVKELQPLNTSDASIFYRKQVFSYNPLGELLSTVYSGADDAGKVTTETVFSDPTYDGEGKLTSFVNEGGYVNHTKYDAIGRAIANWVTDSSGKLTVDPLGNTLKPTCSIYNNATGNLDYVYYDTSDSGDANSICIATDDAPPTASTANQLISYSYDELTGDLLKKTYADGKALSYEYNCVDASSGSAVSCSSPGSGAIYYGSLKSVTDITGMITNYAYNAVQHSIIGSMLTAGLVNNGTTVGHVHYSYEPSTKVNQSCHAGELCSETIGNGDTEYYSYAYDKSTNPYQQVSTVETLDAKGTVVDTISYQYNYIGQITEEKVSDALGDDYTLDNSYDASARLFEQDKTVGSNGTPTKTQYMYDVNGNIVKEVEGSNTTTYAFNGLDQIQNQNISFDAMGDELTNENQDNYYFNALNEPQLVGYKDQATGTVYEYTYYPDGLRASKCIKGQTDCIDYYYSGDQMVNASLDGESSHYLMADSRVQRLLTDDATGKLLGDSGDDDHYYMANFKGTALGHIDGSSGSLVSATQYTPYGAVTSTTTATKKSK